MTIQLNDASGERRAVFEIRDEDLGVFVRIVKREHDYQIRVFDLETGDEVGQTSRARYTTALDFAHACVA
ncbi:hypothetical protein [Thioalkalivibrio sp. ALE16]|uniref:hypothetical protein n=1 Tax=Thioalkalivibrio sp. ALE16 TaxID=1158172 RepID=UPI000379A9AA|nr:hypothetical protein [Thioalkalivibrio sp. ALE16]